MSSEVSRRHFLKGLFASAAVMAMPTLAIAASPAVQAVSAALKGDFINAGALAEQTGDPAAIKLVELLFLREKGERPDIRA